MVSIGGLGIGFASNKGFVAGFLAVDDVISGFGGHEDFDASLGAVDAVGGGAPDQLAIGVEAKDVEGWDHGICTIRLIP